VILYDYVAKNTKTGQTVKATLQAENEQGAARLLQQQGLTPLEIKPSRKGGSARFSRIKAKDKVLFSRQLSTLINAGLPLVQCLQSVLNQTTNKALKVVISQVIADVEAGSTLAKAMGRHPQVFNHVYMSLIEAGESSGTLDEALERLAVQQEKDADTIGKLKGAMIYPIIVLVVMLAVLTFMLIKVLPQVEVLYQGTPGAHLPAITQVMLDLSHFVAKFWYIVILIIAAIAYSIYRFSKTKEGKRVFDRLAMKTPAIGSLFMRMYMARFSRTANTLVSAGVPIIQTLEITSNAIDNVYIQESIAAAIEKVKAGKGLGVALEGDPNFLELVPNMLKIGEQSGNMEQMLGKAADYYEKELDNAIKNISTVIEPAMMVMMGIVALIIVAAVLLPIYGLANQSSITGS